MKIHDLEKKLEEMTGKADNKQRVRAIAHWLEKIRNCDNGTYRCYDEDEIPSLTKISEMHLIALSEGDRDEKIGTVHAKLTHSGEELCKELTEAGYFLKA